MGNNNLIYHYCSEKTFKSIIESKTLWLTKIIKSNDLEESVRTYDIIWPRVYNQLKKRFINDTGALATLDQINNQIQIDKQDSVDEQMNPFGICFSINRDLAQNWNEYGDNSRGMAIGFSKHIMDGIKHDMPHPNVLVDNSIGWNCVYYDRGDLEGQFVQLFTQMLIYNYNTAFFDIPTTLRHYRSFIKNPTFIDEREIRIIYFPTDVKDNNSLCGVSEIKDNGIVHCELPWIKNGICSIEEIIVGTNSPLTIENVKQILADNNVDYDINITKVISKVRVLLV